MRFSYLASIGLVSPFSFVIIDNVFFVALDVLVESILVKRGFCGLLVFQDFAHSLRQQSGDYATSCRGTESH